MSLFSRAATNGILYISIGRFFNVIGMVFTVFFLGALVSLEDLGFYFVAQSLVFFVSAVLIIGSGSSLQVFMSEALLERGVGYAVRTIFIFLALIHLVAFVAFTFAYWLVGIEEVYFNREAIIAEQLAVVVWIYGRTINLFGATILRTLSRFRSAETCDSIGFYSLTIVGLVILSFLDGEVTLATALWLFAGTTVVLAALSVLLCLSAFRKQQWPRRNEAPSSRRIVAVSGAIWAENVATMGFQQGPFFLLGALGNGEIAAQVGVALRASQLLLLPYFVLQIWVRPAIRQRFLENGMSPMFAQLKRLSLASFVLAIVGVGITIVGWDGAIAPFTGVQFSDCAAYYIVLATARVLYSGLGLTEVALLLTGNELSVSGASWAQLFVFALGAPALFLYYGPLSMIVLYCILSVARLLLLLSIVKKTFKSEAATFWGRKSTALVQTD